MQTEKYVVICRYDDDEEWSEQKAIEECVQWGNVFTYEAAVAYAEALNMGLKSEEGDSFSRVVKIKERV